MNINEFKTSIEMTINILNKNYWRSITFFGMVVISMFFAACEDDDTTIGGVITINKVFLEDVNSTVPDREVTFARLGQLLRIEGAGFTGIKKVYINGLSMYFNPIYVSDNSMLVGISRTTPTVEAAEEVRNTIRFVNDNNETIYSFEIRSSAPTVTSISNTMPLAGETITVNGTGLIEVSKITFPGDVVVTDGIVSDVDGEFFTVVVPSGISDEGGAILVECANGGAYSPAYFNFKKGVILDFDGLGQQGYWGAEDASMIHPNDLSSVLIGEGNVSQGTYVAHRPTRIASFAAAKNRLTEVWTAGNGADDWRGQITPYIPAETPVDEIAFQFDVFVPNAWSSTGFLKICMENGFNGGEWARDAYNYVPWVVNGEVVPFETAGWTTVTVPFSEFYQFSDGEFTFNDVIAQRDAASYKNFGIFFENSDFTLSNITGKDSDSSVEFLSSETSVDVYTDNWRIVSLKTQEYSDFVD